MGLECGYGDTSRGVDKAEIGGVEKRNRVRAALSAEETAALPAVLMVNQNGTTESERETEQRRTCLRSKRVKGLRQLKTSQLFAWESG